MRRRLIAARAMAELDEERSGAGHDDRRGNSATAAPRGHLQRFTLRRRSEEKAV
jgi:hypothetical protein